MANILKNEKVKTIVISSLLIVFGLLFCFLPIKFLNTLEIIISIICIIYGIILTLGYSFAPIYLREPLMLIEGILFLIFGTLIIFISDFFVFMVGLIICFYGTKRIIGSKALKIFGEKNWWIDTVLGAIFIVLGLLISILCKTKIVQTAVSILLGCTLICSGICYLILVFALHREFKKLKKSVEPENVTETTDYTIK